MRLAVLAAVGAALVLLFPAVVEAGPGLIAGAAEDDVRAVALVDADARMQLLRLSGFRAVRVTSIWRPGASAPSDTERAILRSVGAAAQRNGVRVYVTVMHAGSATTPLTEEARAQFSSYAAAVVRASPGLRDVIVGNEPNLNRFWLPQFEADGSSASPASYLALLARTYDAVKAADPSVLVYGGAVSPRGSDNPSGSRRTHSPTRFIRELGAAYRASGRTAPVMDAFAIHPYGDHSSQPPTVAHPNTTSIGIADYDKLVALLGEAFGGTGQRGADLPILYGEYGVETQIPNEKAGLYTGTEPAATRPAPEATQAAYYDQALALAFCQPTVAGILLFLTRDERQLAGWQSGVYYADGTPKSSLPAVRGALDRTAGGSVARCPGLQLTVRTTFLRFGTRSAARRGSFGVSFRCSLDCAYRVRLENADTGRARLARRGLAEVGELTRVDLGWRRLATGRYRYALRLLHPVNPGTPTVRTGPVFSLP